MKAFDNEWILDGFTGRVLRKWLYIDSTHDDFESTIEAVAKRIARDDPRFGVTPASGGVRRRKEASGARTEG